MWYLYYFFNAFHCSVPTPALDLLDQMLELDPDKRITAEDSLKCQWLKDIHPEQMEPPK